MNSLLDAPNSSPLSDSSSESAIDEVTALPIKLKIHQKTGITWKHIVLLSIPSIIAVVAAIVGIVWGSVATQQQRSDTRFMVATTLFDNQVFEVNGKRLVMNVDERFRSFDSAGESVFYFQISLRDDTFSIYDILMLAVPEGEINLDYMIPLTSVAEALGRSYINKELLTQPYQWTIQVPPEEFRQTSRQVSYPHMLTGAFKFMGIQQEVYIYEVDGYYRVEFSYIQEGDLTGEIGEPGSEFKSGNAILDPLYTSASSESDENLGLSQPD